MQDGYLIEVIHQGNRATQKKLEVDCCGNKLSAAAAYKDNSAAADSKGPE